jgi:hypothetical protein
VPFAFALIYNYDMIIKDYTEFEFLLKEGLIRTYDINRYNRILTDYIRGLNVNYTIKIIDKLVFYIEVFTNKKDIIENINHQSYTLGYFPSEYTTNVSSIEIKYEAKYDDGLLTNNIICPDKLYHLTYSNNWDSIKKLGLYPKSKNRISVHPERIYLFDDLDNYPILLRNLKLSDNNQHEYILLEIDSKDDSLILHTDPNYRLGYFTYDNIPPNKIKNIEI